MGNGVSGQDPHVQEEWHEKGRPHGRYNKWTGNQMRDLGRQGKEEEEKKQVVTTPLQTQSQISSKKSVRGTTITPSGTLKFLKSRMK